MPDPDFRGPAPTRPIPPALADTIQRYANAAQPATDSPTAASAANDQHQTPSEPQTPTEDTCRPVLLHTGDTIRLLGVAEPTPEETTMISEIAAAAKRHLAAERAQPLTNDQLDAIEARTCAAHVWLQRDQRAQTGQNWLPWSMRTHFTVDMPRLLAEIRQLHTRVDELDRAGRSAVDVAEEAIRTQGELGEEISRQQPVVDAALAWRDGTTGDGAAWRLAEAVDQYCRGVNKAGNNIPPTTTPEQAAPARDGELAEQFERGWAKGYLAGVRDARRPPRRWVASGSVASRETPSARQRAPQEIPPDFAAALLRRASYLTEQRVDAAPYEPTLPEEEIWREALQAAWGAAYAAALGYEVTVSEDGDGLEVGDRETPTPDVDGLMRLVLEYGNQLSASDGAYDHGSRERGAQGLTAAKTTLAEIRRRLEALTAPERRTIGLLDIALATQQTAEQSATYQQNGTECRHGNCPGCLLTDLPCGCLCHIENESAHA